MLVNDWKLLLRRAREAPLAADHHLGADISDKVLLGQPEAGLQAGLENASGLGYRALYLGKRRVKSDPYWLAKRSTFH